MASVCSAVADAVGRAPTQKVGGKPGRSPSGDARPADRGQCSKRQGWPRRQDGDDDSERQRRGLTFARASTALFQVKAHTSLKGKDRGPERFPTCSRPQGSRSQSQDPSRAWPAPCSGLPYTARPRSDSNLSPSLSRWGNGDPGRGATHTNPCDRF